MFPYFLNIPLPWRVCPTCGSDVKVSRHCSADDEWLFVCPSCGVRWTKEELIELALERAFAQTELSQETPYGALPQTD